MEPPSTQITTIIGKMYVKCKVEEMLKSPRKKFKSATGVFQIAIKNKLKGLKHIVVRVDDILVGGENDKEQLNNSKSVFIVLKGNWLKLKREKCVLLKDKVCYLGYKINKEGLNPIPEKIDAVLNAPTPQNITELKTFLSM